MESQQRSESSSGEGAKGFYEKNKMMILAIVVVLVLLAVGYYVMYHTDLMGGEDSAEGLGRGVKIAEKK